MRTSLSRYGLGFLLLPFLVGCGSGSPNDSLPIATLKELKKTVLSLEATDAPGEPDKQMLSVYLDFADELPCHVLDKDRLKMTVDGQVIAPWFLGGSLPDLSDQTPFCVKGAQWLFKLPYIDEAKPIVIRLDDGSKKMELEADRVRLRRKVAIIGSNEVASNGMVTLTYSPREDYEWGPAFEMYAFGEEVHAKKPCEYKFCPLWPSNPDMTLDSDGKATLVIPTQAEHPDGSPVLTGEDIEATLWVGSDMTNAITHCDGVDGCGVAIDWQVAVPISIAY